MRRLMISTAAGLIASSAAMAPNSAFAVAATTGTIADECVAYASTLPNVKWGFQYIVTGQSTTYEVGDINYVGNPQGGTTGNGFADVTQVTTVNATCVAINPAGVPNADHSVDASSTTTIDLGTEKVCQNGNTGGQFTTTPVEPYDAACSI
ncbi:hypothetical protein RFN25_29610 [Mesorhizobium abyssinicae]|uniref:Secreted protein n=1 Tax=Mesorhizobium abyssinicae TaxID=1209958 RepID=A0ABU5AXF6_9HYPH|nr:hypothetical protein [Mesorhizobium abyssinicae]MDX8437568.1 hypothetical protein [Mesorhizobium abyssinicae]MDX8542002.1 hypothetical protein [Mesorhizobium abyssinicae]